MENKFLKWLQQTIGGGSQIAVGVGDDGAVLRLRGSGQIVVATDMLADGTHFVLSECGATRAGHKSLGVNLSDLAAMAADPLAAFVSLALPRGPDSLEMAQAIIEGMLPLAHELNCPLAGGDTNVWDGQVVINVAVIGTVAPRGPWLRSGAQPGDWILVTGACGGSRLGRHLEVEPRVREAAILRDRYAVHAAIDISDGLCCDLSRVAAASRCGAVLELDAVPIHPDADQLAHQSTDDKRPVDHALGDGEDFELILAVPPDDAMRIVRDQPIGIPITRIGEFVREEGLWSIDPAGRRMPLLPMGFEHR